jgi:hypothetical protein
MLEERFYNGEQERLVDQEQQIKELDVACKEQELAQKKTDESNTTTIMKMKSEANETELSLKGLEEVLRAANLASKTQTNIIQTLEHEINERESSSKGILEEQVKTLFKDVNQKSRENIGLREELTRAKMELGIEQKHSKQNRERKDREESRAKEEHQKDVKECQKCIEQYRQNNIRKNELIGRFEEELKDMQNTLSIASKNIECLKSAQITDENMRKDMEKESLENEARYRVT